MSIKVTGTMLGIFFLISSGYANAGLFQSCDEEWEEAWTEHGILGELPEGKRPECKPKDPYLAMHRGGKVGYEKMKELEKKMDEERNLLRINGYKYSVDMGKLYIAADVYNGTSKTIKTATLRCSVVANNAIELYDGPAELEISLISGGRANIPIKFGYENVKSAPKSEITRALASVAGGGIHPALDTMGYRIDELGVECEKLIVF